MGEQYQPEVTVYWQLEAAGAETADTEALETVIKRALAAELLMGAVDLSVTLTGDDEIQRLNAAYRGLDEATDVLSFPLRSGGVEFVSPPDGVLHLGDVVISLPQARRQAAEYGHTPPQELAQLVVHGVLHLVGYDHEDEAQAVVMQAKERAALCLPPLTAREREHP